jgi:hypothetical protein
MMTEDPLLSDDLVAILRVFPEKALRDVIGILAARTSLSPFPGQRAEAAHRAVPGDPLRPHVKEIVDEILWWGSNDILRQSPI